MAATELTPATPQPRPGLNTLGGTVLAASLLLPGLAALAPTAQAETAPEQSTLSLKYADYQDSQPGWNRVRVQAPQLYLQTPLAGGQWALEGSWVGDSVSGASPRLHTQRSGASVMHDYRKAGDLKVTRYLARAAVSASVAYSDEHDYTSRALGLEAHWSTDDNNRSWSLGLGASHDVIDSQSTGSGAAFDERKRTREVMVGVTQVLTPGDIVQVNLTRSVGSGYFNDPYKSFDQRPDQRNAWIALARWNHHVEASNAALRTSWRIYRDSFGISSHTLGAEWVQPVGAWTFTPGLRYTTQSAASFYFNPVLDANGQVDDRATLLAALRLRGHRSADQRLAAWGGVSVSLKAAYALTPQTTLDLRLESYRQSAGLRLGGEGSPGLAPFRARLVQLGVTHRF